MDSPKQNNSALKRHRCSPNGRSLELRSAANYFDTQRRYNPNRRLKQTQCAEGDVDVSPGCRH